VNNANVPTGRTILPVATSNREINDMGNPDCPVCCDAEDLCEACQAEDARQGGQRACEFDRSWSGIAESVQIRKTGFESYFGTR
jgi:hypothetical protein